MKKFKEYYKAVVNPQSAAEWKFWWDTYSGKEGQPITAEQIEKLWSLAKAGAEYSKRGNPITFMAISLGDCWFSVFSTERGTHTIYASAQRHYNNDMDALIGVPDKTVIRYK